MIDNNFFQKSGAFSIEQIAQKTGAQLVLSENITQDYMIENIAPLKNAGANDVSFFSNHKYLEEYCSSNAGLCIVSAQYADRKPKGMSLLISENPYATYAIITQMFYPINSDAKSGIADNAYIAKTAKIGDDCVIEQNAYIGENVVIGNNCRIMAGAYIAKSVQIGDDCIIYPNCYIAYTIMGSKNIIHSGAKIGQDGFGFAHIKGQHIKIMQLGRVVIGSDVEIGANACIDRGTNGDTKIGDNCKIDNLVQIGHNVELGKGCIIVSMVGIGGSTKLGNNVMVGGQAGIAGHLNIGSLVQIAAQSGVMSNIKDGQIVGGSPAMPIKEWHRQTVTLKSIAKKNKNTE
jgi:UDP-3-O-[3-hydroxymyristoyl] glucosamine N-acyltransferase